MKDVHVVLGTGPIGCALIEQLAARGYRVRAVNRSGHAPVPDGVDVVAGDVSNREVAAQVAEGAVAIYQCANPPYNRWPELFPAIQSAAVHAASTVRARFISFENTYMYGDTHGQPMTEATALSARTRKGKVRLAMAQQLSGLSARGDLEVSTARASDYFGPRGTTQSALGDLVIGAALAGRTPRVIGDPDQPHSYTYTVDAVRTLAALGTRDDVAGEVFHIPTAPAQTTRQTVDVIAEQLGSPIRLKSTPRLLLRVMGLFNPTIRELDEMLYEFTQPFIVDSRKAQTRLGIQPTPLDEAIATTVAWFRVQAAT